MSYVYGFAPQPATVSGDDPPIGGYAPSQPDYSAILTRWAVTDSLPWQRPLPQIQSVDIPSFGGYVPLQPEYLTVLSAWALSSIAPMQKGPGRIVSTDNPTVGGYQPAQPEYFVSILSSWIPVVFAAPFIGGREPFGSVSTNSWSADFSIDFGDGSTDAPIFGGYAANQPEYVTILQAWRAPDPSPFGGSWQPLALGTLAPSITAVPVSDPPFEPDYNQPQYFTALSAWIPPDPAPWQRRATQRQSSDNPSFGGYTPLQTEYLTVLNAWIPPSPVSWQEPETQIVSVDNPMPFGYQPAQPEYFSLLRGWALPDPAPAQRQQTQIVSADSPPYGPDYNQPAYWSVLTAWTQLDPLPWQERPSQTVSVDSPPIRSIAWTGPVLNGWILPDPPAFMGGWQPLVLGLLPVQAIAVQVDNPPFLTPPLEASVRTQWDIPPPLPTLGIKAIQPFVSPPAGMPVALWPWLSNTLSTWVPPDPVPTLPRWLNASLTAVRVDIPPFLTPPVGASVRASWEFVPPLPTLAVKALQPFVSPPVGQPTKLWPWLSTILSGWTPSDPAPTLPRWLPAQLTAVRVDTPVGLTRWLQAVASADHPLPTLPRLGVPVMSAAAAAQSYVLSWLTAVLAAWGPADPAQMPRLAGQIVSSDNPPLRSGSWLQPAPWAWQTLEPAPMQRRAAAPVSTAELPRYSSAWAQATPWMWQPAAPMPTLRRPSQTVSVDRPTPLSTGWFRTVLQGWTAPDPAPQQKPPAQVISIDRPPIAGATWLPGVLGKWIASDPLPKLAQVFVPFTFIPPPVNDPPLAFMRGVISVRSAIDAWQPSQPLYRYGLEFLYTPQPLGIPAHGRYVFLQPEMRASLYQPDVRAVLYQPDIRAVLLTEPDADMDPINIDPVFWTAADPNDTDWYYLLLDIWLPSGDTVNSPTVTINAIVGDPSPPSVTGVAIESGAVTLTIAPGVPYVSNGPRIKCKIAGGTIGNTYETVVGWQDSQGRVLSRTVMLPIEDR